MQPLPQGQATKKVKVENALDTLKLYSKVVADSANFNQIQEFKPQDSTTNPTLMNQVAGKPEFAALFQASVKYGLENFFRHCAPKKGKAKKGKKKQQEQYPVAKYSELSESQKRELVELIFDNLEVNFGCEILKRVPGYVSTQIDASLSFDTDATVVRGRRIIQMYKEKGIDKSRVLIKIATTWEGLKAAQILKKDGIEVNMTLIFSLVQAVACANSKLFLISPFVGRVLDYFKQKKPTEDFSGAKDPGVKLVHDIYNYFKKHNLPTIIMGASFRNVSELVELSGCDRLTIAPSILKLMQESNEKVVAKLTPQGAKALDIPLLQISEASFRHDLNSDVMANDRLADGIRRFQTDAKKLEELIRQKLVATG